MGALLLFGLAVGVDNLVVGVSLGTLQLSARRRRTLALLFGLFEAMMPLLGLLIGRELASRFAAAWLGPMLMTATGLLILLGAYHGGAFAEKFGRARWLLLLPMLLSFDNLLAGSVLGALSLRAFAASAVIGFMSAALAWFGLYLGDGAVRRVPLPARLLAGSAVLAIAILELVSVAADKL